jgi:Xaa-Pro dipeptidase
MPLPQGLHSNVFPPSSRRRGSRLRSYYQNKGCQVLEESADFSINERDRRWARVRSLMTFEGIDAIIGIANTAMWGQLQASVRYLTNLGASTSVVFPAEGDVTAVTFQDKPNLELTDAWVHDMRPALFDHFTAIIGRLHELGLQRGRIGIIGLTTGTRFPDGFVAHHGVQRIVASFPAAQLVDATHLVEHVRAAKSQEELNALQRAVSLAEGAAKAMADAARPGTLQSEAYGAIFAHLAKHGGELPTMVQWAVGNPFVGPAAPRAPQRPFRSGDALRVELEANWNGYHGQITMMRTLRAISAREKAALALQEAALDACYQLCRPGVALREMVNACSELAKGTEFNCQLIMNGRGLGDDPPLILPGSNDRRMMDWNIQDNEVFIIKPLISHPYGTQVQWGGVVAATAAGARPLGSMQAHIDVFDNESR